MRGNRLTLSTRNPPVSSVSKQRLGHGVAVVIMHRILKAHTFLDHIACRFITIIRAGPNPLPSSTTIAANTAEQFQINATATEDRQCDGRSVIALLYYLGSEYVPVQASVEPPSALPFPVQVPLALIPLNFPVPLVACHLSPRDPTLPSLIAPLGW